MLDHAAHGRWKALDDVLADGFTIVEPRSLPYGGTHHGIVGYVTLMQEIGELFELAFEPQGLYALDDRTVVLRMNVTFTARTTGRSARLPVVELLDVADGKIQRSEVFLSDTAALLDTLGSGSLRQGAPRASAVLLRRIAPVSSASSTATKAEVSSRRERTLAFSLCQPPSASRCWRAVCCWGL